MGDGELEIGTRKLTAILSADVYGYSRLMRSDEESCLRRLTAYRETIFRLIREHRGRVANTAGDAVLAEFASAKDAASCGIAIQRTLAESNTSVPPDRQMHFRIGLNLGDVYVQRGDLFGDGVNMAARIQSLAEPGAVYISASVYEQLANKSDIPVEYVGEFRVKNIESPVKVYRVSAEAAGKLKGFPWPQTAPEDDFPEKAVIGILPFDNLSNDPDQEYFGDGLCEDLTTAIASFPGISVIARNTMFGFKGKALDIRQLGRDLGASHILEGSVRKAAATVRVNVQLLETATGNHLWAQRYDREITDLFRIQDDIVKNIAIELEVQFVGGGEARRMRKMTQNAQAYDLFLKIKSFSNAFSAESLNRQVDLVDRALKLDPDFAFLYAAKAIFLQNLVDNDWCANEEEIRLQIGVCIEKTGSLNADLGHWANGNSLLKMQKYAEAMRELELAVAAFPDFPPIQESLGWIYSRTGEHQKALAASRHARKLSPVSTNTNIELELMSLQFLGRCEEAYAIARRALADRGDDFFFLTTYAVIAFQLGLEEEAKSLVPKILELQPNFRAEKYASPISDDHRSRYMDMLHQLGLP